MAPGKLVGKAAIVTGGGSGIGRATCQLFAREGASVAVLDINASGIEETLKMLPGNHGNKHCAIIANVTSEEQTVNAVQEAEKKLGQKCTILINSAGINPYALIRDISEEYYYKIMDVNLKGVLLMSKAFLESLTEEGKESPGSIVNISSLAAKVCSSKLSLYSASKAGVIAVTKTTAIEYGKYKVRCNAVLPGFVETPMLDPKMQGLRDEFLKQTPLGRIGQPEDIANACLFLTTEESSYITGATLEVTGGLRM